MGQVLPFRQIMNKPKESTEAAQLNERRVELEIQLVISDARGKDDILKKINFIDDKLAELSKGIK